MDVDGLDAFEALEELVIDSEKAVPTKARSKRSAKNSAISNEKRRRLDDLLEARRLTDVLGDYDLPEDLGRRGGYYENLITEISANEDDF